MQFVLSIQMNINVYVLHKTEENILSAVLITEECNIDKDFKQLWDCKWPAMQINTVPHILQWQECVQSTSFTEEGETCSEFLIVLDRWSVRAGQCFDWSDAQFVPVSFSFEFCQHYYFTSSTKVLSFFSLSLAFWQVLWSITCWQISEQACGKNGLHDPEATWWVKIWR